MEFAFRILLAAVILAIIFGIPLYFCFRGMARQARLGNVDSTKSGKTLTGFGLRILIPIVPIMIYRREWIILVGISLFAGTMIMIGRRAGEQFRT